MNKLSKEKQQQLVLVAIMPIVLIVVLWMLVISTLNTKRSETKSKVAQVQEKISKGEQKVSQTKAVKEAKDGRLLALQKVESEMASGELFNWIDSKLNEFILQQGLDVDIPSKSRGEVGEIGTFAIFPYKAVKYAVRGSAYYHEFGKFVSAFENAYPYIRLQNIELLPGGQFDTGDPERLAFRLEIVALQKPPEQVAEPAKK